LLKKSPDVRFEQHINAALRTTARHFAQALLALTWLPYEAWYSLDAIARTLWRMAISRRRLLQWSPSSESDRNGVDDLSSSFRNMWIGPILSLGTATWLIGNRPDALWQAAPLLALWLLSPAVSWWISRPRAEVEFELAPEQARFLGAMARRTWAFFDSQVGPEDHWLPPDNIQEQPSAVVAHRTSPTNMGLSLLANLAAYDFGYISVGRLLDRTSKALQTMQGLERYRGHFLNWYDTVSLQPLSPRYVSSVDSGNLAGHLLTLRSGLLALVDDRVFGARWLGGLADTCAVLREQLGDGRGADARSGLEAFESALADAMRASSAGLGSTALSLDRLTQVAESLAASLVDSGDAEAEFWTAALVDQCRDVRRDLVQFGASILIPEAMAAQPARDVPTLSQLAGVDPQTWPEHSRSAIDESRARAIERIALIQRLAREAGDMAAMEFDFLYDSGRDLLAIGYNVQERRLDTSFYDLLASEARMTSFVAIAQGQLPQKGWFTLGRLLTTTAGEPVLLSWTGSMFEYLMPLLVMPTYEGTLLDQTCRAAVARQIEYGDQRGVPWGISESGYNTVDIHLNYQYRAFGVPGLGLKRGLADDLVVAPYASALALMVAPEAACQNLQRLAADGFSGRYGLYEAIDYTPARLPRAQSHAVIRSFMAHHQGMTLLSLAYLLLDRPMQKRFEAEPRFQATALLLQERIPKTAAEYLHAAEFPGLGSVSRVSET
jgi:hypothetical protein